MSEETCSAAAALATAGGSGLPVWQIAILVIFAFPTMFWIIMYLVPQIYCLIRPVPDLKKRYDAEWALVTGGGSGIGKAIAFKLAKQGLNVVVVSLDDDILKDTMKQLKETFPKQEFRSVGCAFSPGVDYLKQIQDATKDIEIPIIFNNAGFLVTGFFDQAPLPKLLANVECNATASVNITHHFVSKLVSAKKKGCVVFTSSVAGFIPTPFSGMYGATKAFVSQLACSLHIELQSLGIDVCAVHPSPVSSNFYNNLDHKIEILESACKQAVPPEALPDDIFRSIGVCALRDLGGKSTCMDGTSFDLSRMFFSRRFVSILQAWPCRLAWEHFGCHTTFSPKSLLLRLHIFLTGRRTTRRVNKAENVKWQH
jgi:short-subunit dehydrogenase